MPIESGCGRIEIPMIERIASYAGPRGVMNIYRHPRFGKVRTVVIANQHSDGEVIWIFSKHLAGPPTEPGKSEALPKSRRGRIRR